MATISTKHTYFVPESVCDPKDHAVAVATLTASSAADGGWFEVYVTSAAQIDVVTVDDVSISVTPAAGVLPYRLPFKVKSVADTSVAAYICVR